jgi:glucose-6-phosphate isomerase
MKKLAPEIHRLGEALEKEYDTPYASLNLPTDAQALTTVKKLANKYRAIKAIVVIGIGGSNLGTMAVQQALQGRLHNEFKGTQIYWVDTVDAHTVAEVIDALPPTGVLLNVVSKSGGTTETIANFEVLQRAVPRAKVVVTTDEGSKLWKFAKKKNYPTLAIPQQVGGRYSVFSPVGLFPLAVLGIDIDQLLEGATDMRTQCLPPFTHNPAAMSAMAHYVHSKRGRNIANTFLFAPDFEAIGKWYRQLMGESIGKEHNKSGTKRVLAGITPTVATGSTDLHSMAQLYLGGPDDKFTTIVTLAEEGGLQLPKRKEFNALVPHIQGKSLVQLMNAIIGGVLIAYKKSNRPFVQVVFPNRGPYAIGQFLQFKMIEMMLLGYLLNVNPFDQPAVERYKVETKRLLE